MEKTLGGDRLGSGKKLKVELHGYERSTHDKSHKITTSMSAGTLVPFYKQLALPGDTYDIELNCEILTHPTIGPLFDGFKVQLDIHVAPIRLYIGKLHNNKLGLGMEMKNVKLPIMTFTPQPITDVDAVEDIDNCQVNPSAILSYLGLRGFGVTPNPDVPRSFNGLPLLAYWDIYKTYYANKQEEIGAVIHTPFATTPETITSIEIGSDAGMIVLGQNTSTGPIPIQPGGTIEINYTGTVPNLDAVLLRLQSGGFVAISSVATLLSDSGTILTLVWNVTAGPEVLLFWQYTGTGTGPIQGEIKVQTFPLSEIDSMREKIMADVANPNAFSINTANLQPYNLILDANELSLQSSQEGLGIKTYQSDIFNNWLQTEWIDGPGGINEITRIDTSAGYFNIDALLLGRKVYDVMNRIAVSGGSYDDWLDVVYDHNRFTKCESPMYMGGLIKELVFQQVVSQSEATSEESSQPLGTLAGKGVMGNKHKGGHVTIKIDEPSYIIGIISLTPRIGYSQGNDWDTGLITMDDLRKPGLDGIGFQELTTEKMAWWSTTWNTTWNQKSAGKQPAWLDYMTAYNRILGNFAIKTNEMFMTLNRRYEHGPDPGEITDLTTYIDPSKFNHIFAQTALDAQNFWATIGMNITYRGKLSAKVMPNL